MGLFPAYRGIKIKPYMVNLRYFIFSFFFSPQEWMLPVDSLHLAACAIVGICCDNGLGGLFCEGSVDAYNVSDGQNVG